MYCVPFVSSPSPPGTGLIGKPNPSTKTFSCVGGPVPHQQIEKAAGAGDAPMEGVAGPLGASTPISTCTFGPLSAGSANGGVIVWGVADAAGAGGPRGRTSTRNAARARVATTR